MNSEILLNAGYTVLGGGLAAIFGFVSQWVYARKQRKDGIKKMQELCLKMSLTDLHCVDERKPKLMQKNLKKYTSTIEEQRIWLWGNQVLIES